MKKDVLVREILKGMEYKEDIRNGIWVNNNPDYQELFFYAHDGMLPDDFRYKMIHDILCNMDEDTEEDEIEFLDSLVPIYSDDLLQWVSSNVSRISYCDEYQDEFDGSALKLTEIITGGYFEELQEIYNLITEWLDENTNEE